MSTDVTLPPARERHRLGIGKYSGEPAAGPLVALFDRVVIKAKGLIALGDETALENYADTVGTDRTSLFGRPHRTGKRWLFQTRNEHTTISRCKMAMWRADERPAQFELDLTVNPMRTLAHLLDRYIYQDLASLSPRQFFEANNETTAGSITLDGRDNMVADFRAFSGTYVNTKLQRVAEYLAMFERNLVALMLEELCPPSHGFDVHQTDGQWHGRNQLVHLTLNWGDVTVSQAEVCWEWNEPDALAQAHDLAEMAFRAARSTDITFFPQQHVARVLGSPSVRIPLGNTVDLAIYAKARDRLRFEVRYKKDLPDMVKRMLPARPRTLVQWFDVVREHAHSKVPWQAIEAALAAPAPPAPDALTDVIEAIIQATGRDKALRKDLIRCLLSQGAVTATGPRGPFPHRVLKRLADMGVVDHVRFIGRDNPIGRRYFLSSQYSTPLINSKDLQV